MKQEIEKVRLQHLNDLVLNYAASARFGVNAAEKEVLDLWKDIKE